MPSGGLKSKLAQALVAGKFTEEKMQSPGFTRATR